MSDKLKMHTPNKADENFAKLAAMFPNAVTETKDENGDIVRAIDKDVLMQEISCKVVEGREERYQFTWPDKKKSVLLANAPINKTLRPCREESVDFDNTENLYIEGDNLEVLKLLQETYLGKIKMIYIDPPYNTGNDFVYNDDYKMSSSDWDNLSGEYDENGMKLSHGTIEYQKDEQGNKKLVLNSNSNGRFHTDWLNMIYPRLKLAKDLLADDGVIFISIDDNEVENLTKIGKEVFGDINFINALKWKRKKQPSFLSRHIAPVMEYVLIFAKNSNCLGKLSVEKVGDATKKVINISNQESERVFKEGVEVKGIENGIIPKGVYTVKTMNIEYLNDVIVEEGRTTIPVTVKAKFLNTQDKITEFINGGLLFITATKGLRRYVSPEESEKEKSITDLLLDWGDNQDSEKEQKDLFGDKYFDYTKPIQLLYNLAKSCTSEGDIVMDFFSGSATTAHAVMQLNAEDGGNRKFIMVQLPEETEEKSEAYKAGYKTICEIGKERIRRAAKKIAEENPEAKFDGGFRVLKCDTTNMKDVYYNPSEFNPSLFDKYEDNIKEDRTPEDLLFQVMLELGVLLSSKIEETTICGKKVFNVADNFLMACFDYAADDEVITEIAKKKPYYFVMRDYTQKNDSVANNFEQLFKTYSPETKVKVL